MENKYYRMTNSPNKQESENTNKRVSVVMPCYNDAKYLQEAVMSVLDSSYPNIEVLIVNDGSTDNTKEVGLLLEKQYSNVIYLEQSNHGVAAARNYGVEQSSGQLILPLDADDKISKDYVALAAQVLQNKEQMKVVYCEAEFFGNKSGDWRLPQFSRKMLARENMIFSSAMYRKKDFIDCGGYSESMLGGWEDWEFWISMLKDGGKVYKIPKVCFFYRIKPPEKSRRKGTNREVKRDTIDFLNSKHSDFMLEQLNGPLRYMRTWSVPINTALRFIGSKSLLV